HGGVHPITCSGRRCAQPLNRQVVSWAMLSRWILVLDLAAPSAVVAGGDSFACRVVAIDQEGSEELRITLRADIDHSRWVPNGDPDPTRALFGESVEPSQD